MLTIKMMKKNKGDRVVNLDRSTLAFVLKSFANGFHSIVVFDKEWIVSPPYGRTAISIPEGIRELRISRNLVGRPLGEEVYLNLFEKEGGYYILKVGPARFESSKQGRGYSMDEFLQKWQELYPEEYKAWKEGGE